MATTGQKPLREWQITARTKLYERWRDDPSYRALIAACPGSGKTLLGVNVADDLLREQTVELVLVLVPSVNVQMQWVRAFKAFGIKATKDANNEALRWRRDRPGHTMIEDKHAIVITYLQLARDPDLFAELARRHKTFVIPDEIHHADDDRAYGEAINIIAAHIVRSMALSGTPFNTAGGSLALCETEAIIDAETGKPTRQTIPTYKYSYGDAVDESVCRYVDFVKVEGRGRATYRSLTDSQFFERIVRTAQKADSLRLLLNPDGEYVQQCIREGLIALTAMREAGDKNAAMLVVAKDVSHGNRLIDTIEEIKAERQEWSQFANIQGIFNDTEKAHDRIRALENDNTDIIVSVRMISEGVDVQRLRVGVYLTDIETRMFFIQFVGRFIRYETRAPLDQSQHAVVVIPARPDLLIWAREIEQMILANQIRLAVDGDGTPPERKNELIGCETEAEGISLTFRGAESSYQKEIIEMMYEKSMLFRQMAPSMVIQIAKDMGYAAGARTTSSAAPPPVDWSKRNDNLVSQIVRVMRSNGESDQELYARINAQANAHVGIPKKDKMTPDDVLQRRWQFLQQMLMHIVNENNPDLFRAS